MPVSHLTLTVSHLPTSTSFFLSCLQPLGYQFIGRHDKYIGFGQKQGEPADFWLTEQNAGIPPSAVHIAFPAISKDAVGSFFICALKAGGKIHGEPKTRDKKSGYYNAAVIDFDGNSIEAVFRPENAAAATATAETMVGLLGNGSVLSSSPGSSNSYAGGTVKAESIASRSSKAKSVFSTAPSTILRHSHGARPPYITQTVPKSDDGSQAAKTIVGTLLGAAAGAAIAYAMVKGDSQSPSSDEMHNAPAEGPPRYTLEYPQTQTQARAHSQTGWQEQEDFQRTYRAIEAPPVSFSSSLPTRSIISSQSKGARSTQSNSSSRSISLKNPHASTIYSDTKSFIADNDPGRRASEGSIYKPISELPLRAIEYQPPSNAAQQGWYPCNPSTFISSYAVDQPGHGVRVGSLHSSSSSVSTIKQGSRRHIHSHGHSDDRDGYSRPVSGHSSRHSQTERAREEEKEKERGESTNSSTRTARNIPLPESTFSSSSSSAISDAKGKNKSKGSNHSCSCSTSTSYVSARAIPLPESILDLDLDLDVESQVTPDDSISQVGMRGGSRRTRSTHSDSHSHSHHSHSGPHRPSSSSSTHSKHFSRASKRTAAAAGRSCSKVEEKVVTPSDSVSQVSSRVSQRTIKAAASGGGESKAASRVRGSRRGSQVV